MRTQAKALIIPGFSLSSYEFLRYHVHISMLSTRQGSTRELHVVSWGPNFPKVNDVDPLASHTSIGTEPLLSKVMYFGTFQGLGYSASPRVSSPILHHYFCPIPLSLCWSDKLISVNVIMGQNLFINYSFHVCFHLCFLKNLLSPNITTTTIIIT